MTGWGIDIYLPKRQKYLFRKLFESWLNVRTQQEKHGCQPTCTLLFFLQSGWGQVVTSLTVMTYGFSPSADRCKPVLTYRIAPLNQLQCLVLKHCSIWEESRACVRHEKIWNCSEKSRTFLFPPILQIFWVLTYYILMGAVGGLLLPMSICG